MPDNSQQINDKLTKHDENFFENIFSFGENNPFK